MQVRRFFCAASFRNQAISFPCDRFDPVGKSGALEFSSGSQNTLPNASFAGIVIVQDILPDIFLGKRQIRRVEKLFQ